ncbi:MAG: ATP-binding protein [bacterium]
MTLFHRLLLLIFGVGLVPVIPTGILLFYYQSVAKSNTLDLHASVSRMAAIAVRQNFENLNRRLAFAEELEKTSDFSDNGKASSVIKGAMAANPDFLLTAVLDGGGRELLKVGTPQMLRRYGFMDLSGNQVFAEARATRRPVLSNFESISGIPAGMVVSPLGKDRFFFMIVSFGDLWSRLRGQKIGATGRIFFCSPQGRLLRLSGEDVPETDPDFLLEMLSETEGKADYIPARDNVYVGAFSRVPDFNLFVVTLQARDEAFWILRLTTSLLIFFLLAIATASYFAALFSSRKLAGPIVDLAEGARRVAMKDFNVPVNEKEGIEEFRKLARAFNEMMSEVKKYHGLQLEQILQEKEKLDLLIRLMNDGIVLANLRGEVLYANQTALEALNVPPEEGEPAPASDSAKNEKRRLRVNKIIGRGSGIAPVEIEVPGKEGKRGRVFRTSVQDFSAGTDEPGIFIIMRDITLEREMDAMKDDFFQSAAHDLRAPLLSMEGYVKLLESSCASSPEASGYVAALKKSGDRLFFLIHDILDMARMEAGQMRLELSAVEPADFLRRVSEPFIPMFAEKKLSFETRMPEAGQEPFEADQHLLERALQNLLSNAVKFTPGGGRISLEYSRHGPDVELAVSDTGPGVPDGKKTVIFEKFRRLEDTGAQEKGFGLGLAICRRIAELHGGGTRVEDGSGGGSRFVIRFPRRDMKKKAP